VGNVDAARVALGIGIGIGGGVVSLQRFLSRGGGCGYRAFRAR